MIEYLTGLVYVMLVGGGFIAVCLIVALLVEGWRAMFGRET